MGKTLTLIPTVSDTAVTDYDASASFVTDWQSTNDLNSLVYQIETDSLDGAGAITVEHTNDTSFAAHAVSTALTDVAVPADDSGVMLQVTETTGKYYRLSYNGSTPTTGTISINSVYKDRT